MRDYGQAQNWASVVLDGQEIIPAGHAARLEFIWLSGQQEQQRRVSRWIRSQGRR